MEKNYYKSEILKFDRTLYFIFESENLNFKFVFVFN
jgi:hypothetical protein